MCFGKGLKMTMIERQLEINRRLGVLLQQKQNHLQGISTINEEIKKLSRELCNCQSIAQIKNGTAVVLRDADLISEKPLRKGRGPHPATYGQLHDYISRAMAPGAFMSLRAISEKVLELGYITKSKTFCNSVSRALQFRKDIKIMSKGVYMRRDIGSVLINP